MRRLDNVLADLRNAYVYIAANNPRWNMIVPLWDQYESDHWEGFVQGNYDWLVDALVVVDEQFAGSTDTDGQRALRTISLLWVMLDSIRLDGHFTPRRRH